VTTAKHGVAGSSRLERGELGTPAEHEPAGCPPGEGLVDLGHGGADHEGERGEREEERGHREDARAALDRAVCSPIVVVVITGLLRVPTSSLGPGPSFGLPFLLGPNVG
jgi:hypothetical protein